MTNAKVCSEIQKLEPSALIELFVLDGTDRGMGIFYFHAGTNEINGDIVWQGQAYVKFPIEASGFDINGQGQLPRPKLKASNFMGSITALLLAYDDLVGAKVTRKRTFKKYLDAVNFVDGNPTADPTVSFPEDIFFIDRKAMENNEYVEFELASSLDLAGVQLPRRQIVQNLCSWKYRGGECGYAGTNYFKADDSPTSNASEDACGKRLSSCKKRFGSDSELPYGGFPGTGLYR